MGIINKNTSNEDIENAKQEAWNVFNAYLNNDYRADNVIKALQSTVDTLYKEDNCYSDLLQKTCKLFNNKFKQTKHTSMFY